MVKERITLHFWNKRSRTMFVKNNLAPPGEIKSAFLYPNYVDVKLHSGEVLHYVREKKRERDEVSTMSSLPEEGAIQSAKKI